jgi:hypothetical protein
VRPLIRLFQNLNVITIIKLFFNKTVKIKFKDGALYITTTGNVRNKNSILKEAEFKWNVGRKISWKAA